MLRFSMLFLISCGALRDSDIPTVPNSGGSAPAFRPSDDPYVNPECRNPFPVDAFAGLDGQRISYEEFIDGASGAYELWQTDFYAREDRASPVAIHVRSWLTDRAPEKRAEAAQEARCQREAAALSEGGAVMPDRIVRHDGTLTNLWPTGFRFESSESGPQIFFQSAFNASVPSPSTLREWLGANAREAMIFRRNRSQYEIRMKVDQAPRETTVSAIYLWAR